MIEQRDLLLVPFPFSDQSGTKVRPVIVMSNDLFNSNSEDLIVIGVTSQISKGKYTISLTNEFLEQGKLNNNCVIKVENILKIDNGLVIKKIGRIKSELFDKIVQTLIDIIN